MPHNRYINRDGVSVVIKRIQLIFTTTKIITEPDGQESNLVGSLALKIQPSKTRLKLRLTSEPPVSSTIISPLVSDSELTRNVFTSDN
jgi:hypothetical protein